MHFLPRIDHFFVPTFGVFLCDPKPPVLFVQDQSWTILSSVVVVGKLLFFARG